MPKKTKFETLLRPGQAQGPGPHRLPNFVFFGFFGFFGFPNAFLVLFGHLGSRPGLQGWDSMLTGSRAPRTLVWQWTATRAGYRLRQLLSGCSWHPCLHWLHERSQTPEAKTIDYRPQTIDHSLWTMDHKL